MHSIEVSNLKKRFPHQDRDVLTDVSFALAPHECAALLGPSGCGKTTLLRLLMGLEQASAGSLRIAPALAGHISYVFQEPRLIPWRTSFENVRLPLELRSGHGIADQDILDLLAQLGLDTCARLFPRELSGGMQMRVALARALITRPKILLLDEPFAALDERTRFRLQDLLLDLKERYRLQYLFVTHSIAEAVYLGDRVLLLDRHGRISADQHIDLGPRDQTLKLSAPFNDCVRAFSERFIALENAA